MAREQRVPCRLGLLLAGAGLLVLLHAPAFQTSTVALSRTEAALGHAERARAIAAQYSEVKETTTDDPWWNYRLGGFVPGAVTWLRQEARRQ